MWIWANRPSNKVSKLLFPMLKANKNKKGCGFWWPSCSQRSSVSLNTSSIWGPNGGHILIITRLCRVRRPSSCWFVHELLFWWTCCQSTLLQTCHPNLVSDCANSSSQDNNRSTQARNDVTLRQLEVTTHQLSVPAPHPKLLPAPKSLTSVHEVINQLYKPIPHSVIASDVKMCRSTPPQLCPNPSRFLLNQARVPKPKAEHKTQSVW